MTPLERYNLRRAQSNASDRWGLGGRLKEGGHAPKKVTLKDYEHINLDKDVEPKK